MKRFILILSILTLSLFADPISDQRPVYKLGFYSLINNKESLHLSQHIRNQILSSKRGEAVLQSQTTITEELPILSNGDFDTIALKKINPLEIPEKLVITRSSSGNTQIQLIDVETGKIEYKNSLPDSIAKTLIQDFYSFLDKKNIYLALSERKSSPTSPLKFSQLKSKYIAGEAIRFELEANEDNYVYVVFIPEEKSEEPVLLFPSPSQSANFLRKGDRVIIPEGDKSLRATPPYGRDKIKAFASKEEWTDFQFKTKKGESFFKLLPPALTGSKSVSLSEVMAKTIWNTAVTEWEIEISPN
jgi:hypothetical protein